ncbi:putative acyl-CoA dehydrogenase [Actinoplanes missouriensis 431]|uniref:Putative acyl-CoA dehydrogenase n=1 Tax=Actinoplanes missouriensis (strain ATCC 14538 / DSM 43046 / CBS 188.64 / JCM 3121 / NBRC 102363 / NCIMB 12654 / NRRL B-3342 / UNCC 431) TaxID=512565 RepID=I0H2A7_ACTM4|nr:acyl-CoA dehydrogenase family protein [Actinoplanes missouriensis]BAL87144.1 putative acyl-CoA dehydrogenase [Actinoplanes missouriensis 431]
MRLAPSAEEAAFAASLHEALGAARAMSGAASAAPFGAPSGAPSAWWRLGALGVTGLAVPERFGGAGAPASALVVAAEELGHHAVPGPVAASIAAVPVLLAEGGDLGAKWLPELAAGRVAAALTAPPWLPLEPDAAAAWMPEAAAAGAAGIVVRVEPGVVRLGAADSAGDVVAEGPAVAPLVARALNLGALVCAAQLLGLGRAMLEASVAYAKAREQFGGPIGRFQAVQHRLADVAVGLEFARPLLYAAAAVCEEPSAGTTAAAVVAEPGIGNADRDVSAAKVACGEAAHRAARAALQIHGALGYTREHGLERWLTATRVLRLAWGTPAQHRERIMAELARET